MLLATVELSQGRRGSPRRPSSCAGSRRPA